MTYKVSIKDNYVYQDEILVATIVGGWGFGSDMQFLVRSRNGTSEAKSFLRHMLKIMTVSELAEIVKKTSPVEAGAHHGWVMPHLKTWVKSGKITQERLNVLQSHHKESYAKKMGL